MAGVFEVILTRIFSRHFLHRDKLEDDGTPPRPSTEDHVQTATVFHARTRPSYDGSSFHTGDSGGDITHWGTYLEHAPPVLPLNITAPGFEPLSRRKRADRRKGSDISNANEADDSELDDKEGEESGEEDFTDLELSRQGDNEASDRHFGTSNLGEMPGLSRGSKSGNNNLRARNKISFPSLQSLFPLASFFPFTPTTTTASSTSSSLFGSTTRPASDRTIESDSNEQPISILRRASDFYLRWEHWVPISSTAPNSSPYNSSARAVTAESAQHITSNSVTTTRNARMAPKTHKVVSLWFLLTAPVIFWDAMYCFMRPRSMRGGDLHWIWSPYSLYQDVDLIYGLPSFESGDGFTNAQSALNIVETLLNLYYIYLQHVTQSPVAPLVGISSAIMTLSKTVLYWAQEYFCNYCAVGHNDLKTLFWLWIVPNGLWLVFPTIIIATLAKDITTSLRAADKPASKKQ